MAAADIQVEQTWDLTIIHSGRSLSKIFARLPQKCSTKYLEKRGAGQQAIAAWQKGCDQALRAITNRIRPRCIASVAW